MTYLIRRNSQLYFLYLKSSHQARKIYSFLFIYPTDIIAIIFLNTSLRFFCTIVADAACILLFPLGN